MLICYKFSYFYLIFLKIIPSNYRGTNANKIIFFPFMKNFGLLKYIESN
jgi:hypothetical protein